jgi:hypothetical protein
MPDSEMFKLIIQLGSFGLLAVIVVWLLRYGVPLLKATIEAKDRLHAETLAKVVETFDEALTRHDGKHDAAVEKILASHEKQLARRDAADEKRTAALEKLTEVVDRLSDRVGVIERRTDEYPKPPHPRRP